MSRRYRVRDPSCDPPQPLLYPDLKAAIAPLLDVQYPSRALFERALTFRYLQKRPTLPAGPIVALARKQIPFNSAPPLTWANQPGCGCIAPPDGPSAKVIYGFFAFWRSTTPPPEVAFDQVNRIGLIGLQLRAAGDWIQPTNATPQAETWWNATSAFARAAHAHGSRLDLVLRRGDWRFLHGMPPQQVQILAEVSARNAMALADTPLEGRGVRHLLLPFWKDPTHVFDGVTVMFDEPDSGADADEWKAYADFQDGFIHELILIMQANKRPYTLNIVAPDSLAGAPSPPPPTDRQAAVWHSFLGYKQLAERASRHHDLPKDERARYIGSTDIAVRLLTPVRESTSADKKVLRASLDQIPGLRGNDRVAVLQSVVPILYLPGGGTSAGKPPPRALSPVDGQQLDDDLVYFRQNFGGVALWPVPAQATLADKEASTRLAGVFFGAHVGPLGVSLVLCSLILRLAWQALVLLTIVGAFAYIRWGQVSRHAQLYTYLLFGLCGLTAAASLFLLMTDTALKGLAAGNLPLLILIVGGGLIGAWFIAKPRIPAP
ncbi:hypothetical protein [Phenylobacterium sp.]|uniref:hypothetical protein n=1 Tax=Phenylobacterium sp. TaxID=1871053 RepID=UPI0025F83702|nr:hypothetical protein [Phenylobacterium sp.]